MTVIDDIKLYDEILAYIAAAKRRGRTRRDVLRKFNGRGVRKEQLDMVVRRATVERKIKVFKRQTGRTGRPSVVLIHWDYTTREA